MSPSWTEILFDMLSDPANAEAIGWNAAGNGLVIRSIDKFSNEVLPKGTGTECVAARARDVGGDQRLRVALRRSGSQWLAGWWRRRRRPLPRALRLAARAALLTRSLPAARRARASPRPAPLLPAAATRPSCAA